jgi:hypothetical protein
MTSGHSDVRAALEQIECLLNGDRATVNERNALAEFGKINDLLVQVRGIANQALQSVRKAQ